MTRGEPRGSVDSAGAELVIIGKPGCHLCDAVRSVVTQLAAEFGLEVAELSVLDHPDLLQEYGEMIPVTLVDGRVHDYWRVDADRLRAALVARC